MKVGMHQPNFCPYAGFFQKMKLCDVFVILDEVQLEWGRTQRNRIISREGVPQWFRMPVARQYKFSKINEVKIDYDNDFPRLLKQLRVYENESTSFEKFYNFFEGLNEYEYLHEVNLEIIMKIASMLKIDTKIVRQSRLDVNSSSTQRLVDICNVLGADKYLSGQGGKNYMDESLFKDIEVEYQKYEPIVYEQKFSKEFVPNLSILDPLLTIGLDRTAILI